TIAVTAPNAPDFARGFLPSLIGCARAPGYSPGPMLIAAMASMPRATPGTSLVPTPIRAPGPGLQPGAHDDRSHRPQRPGLCPGLSSQSYWMWAGPGLQPGAHDDRGNRSYAWGKAQRISQLRSKDGPESRSIVRCLTIIAGIAAKAPGF